MAGETMQEKKEINGVCDVARQQTAWPLSIYFPLTKR
jgi:hypothetical protein